MSDFYKSVRVQEESIYVLKRLSWTPLGCH
jgi:hypothetical protein